MRVLSTQPPFVIELSTSELAEIQLALEEHRQACWRRLRASLERLGPGPALPGPEVFLLEIDAVLAQLEVLDPSGAAEWVDDGPDIDLDDESWASDLWSSDLFADGWADGALLESDAERSETDSSEIDEPESDEPESDRSDVDRRRRGRE